MGTLSGIIDNFSTVISSLGYSEQSERVPLRKAVGSHANNTYQIKLGETTRAEGFFSDDARLELRSIVMVEIFYKKNFTGKTLYKSLADSREETIKALEATSNQATNQISTDLDRATWEDVDDNIIVDVLEFTTRYKINR